MNSRPPSDVPRFDSAFFSLVGDDDGPPWNARLLTEPPESARAPMGPRSVQAVQAMRAALDRGDLERVPVQDCPCGAPQFERLSGFDRFALPFATVICRTCGLIHLDPFISDDSLRLYYDRFYHPLHFSVSLAEQRALYQAGQGAKIYDLVRPYFDGRDRIKVLEVGAGTGSVLAEFMTAAGDDFAMEVLGTEFSHECIEIAKRQGVHVQYGGLDEVVAQEKQFDLVILSHVFEHFTDLPKELEKLQKVMAPEAVVYVEVPGVMSLHDRAVYAFDYLRYITHAHVYHFNLTSLADVFARGGFALMQGNEVVEAIFRRESAPPPVDTTTNYHRLITYLQFLEQTGEARRQQHERLARLQYLEDRVPKLESQLTRARAYNDRLTNQAARLSHEVERMVSSKSWQVTAPLREVLRTVHRFRAKKS